MTQEVRIIINAEVDIVQGKIEIEQLIKVLFRHQDVIDIIDVKVEEEAEIYKVNEDSRFERAWV